MQGVQGAWGQARQCAQLLTALHMTLSTSGPWSGSLAAGQTWHLQACSTGCHHARPHNAQKTRRAPRGRPGMTYWPPWCPRAAPAGCKHACPAWRRLRGGMAMAFITDSPHQLPSCLVDAGRLTRPTLSCGDIRTLLRTWCPLLQAQFNAAQSGPRETSSTRGGSTLRQARPASTSERRSCVVGMTTSRSSLV